MMTILLLMWAFMNGNRLTPISDETCEPTPPVALDLAPNMTGDAEGALAMEVDTDTGDVKLTFWAGAGVEPGVYESVVVNSGTVVMAVAPSDPNVPDPKCMLRVSIVGNRAVIECSLTTCSTHCGLDTFVPANGPRSYSCFCNKAPEEITSPNYSDDAMFSPVSPR
jgi:hypothetical protein